jgi:BirA family biotin operon repressor/biotin-[acetyl-CoA-carboxylase] ligase
VIKLPRSNGTNFKIKLEILLKTNRFGNAIYFFDELDSTQDYANGLPIINSTHGTIVIAKRQKMGKGRIGRSWISPNGGLWMSVILRPEFSVNSILFTQFIGAIAVAEAIMQVTKIKCTLKWPNDVLIDGKKVCGILVDVNLQGNDKVIVIGIGLNANIASSLVNDNLIDHSLKATSLSKEYGNEVDLAQTTKAIVDRLEHYYYELLSNGKTLEIIDLWKKNSDVVDKKATVYDGDETVVGQVIDIDENGALLMKLGDGSIRSVSYYNNVTFR